MQWINSKSNCLRTYPVCAKHVGNVYAEELAWDGRKSEVEIESERIYASGIQPHCGRLVNCSPRREFKEEQCDHRKNSEDGETSAQTAGVGELRVQALVKVKALHGTACHFEVRVQQPAVELEQKNTKNKNKIDVYLYFSTSEYLFRCVDRRGRMPRERNKMIAATTTFFVCVFLCFVVFLSLLLCCALFELLSFSFRLQSVFEPKQIHK